MGCAQRKRISMWIDRVAHHLDLFDILRSIISWTGRLLEVPVGEDSMNGRWVEAPVINFFSSLRQHISNLPLVAEDLGLITPESEKSCTTSASPDESPPLRFTEENRSIPICRTIMRRISWSTPALMTITRSAAGRV